MNQGAGALGELTEILLSLLPVERENAADRRVADAAPVDDARRDETWNKAVTDVMGAWNLILGFVILGLLIVAIKQSA
ncbi:hypothetical protein [Paraburkholderia sediminicola]|uniref:hypothetical protein n=1 Tax=Paraburkholderia sediminicola TaxID=458836 RepID=UPI0038BD09A3